MSGSAWSWIHREYQRGADGVVTRPDVLTLQVDLTNEEMQALEPRFSELDAQLTKKLTATEHQPHSRVALAYEAFRKLWSPIRQHLATIRTPVPRGKP